MRPVRLVMMFGLVLAALFSAVTFSGQSNPASAAQATGSATVAPPTAGGSPTQTTSAVTATTGAATAVATSVATTVATTGATTGGGATAVPPTATLTLTATRTLAGRATAGPRPVVFGPCPNPNVAAPTATRTVARTATLTVTPANMATGLTVVAESRTAPLTQSGQFEMVHQVLDFEPGASTPPHVNPGTASAIVIEGEVTFCTATTQQVFHTGESWTEHPNTVGQIVNTGSTVARLSFAAIVPRNAQPMIPVPVITATPGGTR